jgi:hypothetical protein
MHPADKQSSISSLKKCHIAKTLKMHNLPNIIGLRNMPTIAKNGLI